VPKQIAQAVSFLDSRHPNQASLEHMASGGCEMTEIRTSVNDDTDIGSGGDRELSWEAVRIID